MARYGEYLVKKMFEGGAQGRTFLTERELEQKLFVLKIVSYYTKEQKEKADREIAQMKRLESPFTVRLMGTFLDRTDICMVLEYCENGDLRNVIADLQKLSEPERVQSVWELLAQIGLSLNHLHSNEVVHRDIKPENIFIMVDGSSRLGDFGLVKELGDKSYGTAVGTKPYMAPEVFMFQKMDRHSDMFSLGIVVCEMLTGKHPFDGGSDQATIQKIIRNDVAKLPSFVPKEMLELITSMIDPKPASRPEIKQVLEQSTIKMYIRLQEGKRKAEERALLAEQQKLQAEEQVHLLEIRVQTVEERARLAEQQQRESIEHNRAVEQWAQTAEERARVAEERLRTKDTEIIRLQQENDRLRSSSAPVQSSRGVQSSAVSVPQIPNPIKLKLNISNGDEGRIQRSSFIHSNNNDWSTITMDPIINQGIARFEAIFSGHEGKEFSLGIAEASKLFQQCEGPDGTQRSLVEILNIRPDQIRFLLLLRPAVLLLRPDPPEHGHETVRFEDNGNLAHIIKQDNQSSPVVGNSPFHCGQKVSIEVDMNQRKAYFFIDGEEQKNFVFNIPYKIRFYAFIQSPNSSFQVTKFEMLQKSSARGVRGSRGWYWGKEWKQ